LLGKERTNVRKFIDIYLYLKNMGFNHNITQWLHNI